MSNKKRLVGALIAGLLLLVMGTGSAVATHINRINDGTDPNSTKYNGQNCSVDAITPSGDYTIDVGGFAYSLRYSANCRSIWGRSLNGAPRRNDMQTHRHSSPTNCTNDVFFSGSTYQWTAQLDDYEHIGNLHLNYSGWSDCSAAHAQYFTSTW
jgi:hypothetical protein